VEAVYISLPNSLHVEWTFTGVMRFDRDVLAHFDAGFVLDSRDLLEVAGDAGSLLLEDPWHVREPGIQLKRVDVVERIEIERANSYRLEAENMSAAIRRREPLLLGRADADGQARAIEALYEAAERGRAVRLA
jgi:D-xylose 1-dehydrogenase (NADP+, D-xylono-1,5-lactone-forming)